MRDLLQLCYFLAKTSCTTVNMYGKSRPTGPFPNFKEMALSFHLFHADYEVGETAFIMLKCVPCMPGLSRTYH